MSSRFEFKYRQRTDLTKSNLSVFMMMRNEDYFLPHIFDHYRNMDVDHFVVYDDRSGSITRDFLAQQNDCTVIYSDKKYHDSFGVKPDGSPRRLSSFLKEQVPRHMLSGRWVLTVDADEFLVLPPGVKSLPRFTKILDSAGRSYSSAPMVDFYGLTLNSHSYDPAINPFVANPYFDVGPYFEWAGEVRPRTRQAGIRARLMTMLYSDHKERLEAIYGGTPKLATPWKVPLIKEGGEVRRVGDHDLNLAPDGALNCALAHFKFYPGLTTKIETALSEGQYYNGSVEYRFLEMTLEILGDKELISGETRRFSGSQSLVDANLIQSRDPALLSAM